MSFQRWKGETKMAFSFDQRGRTISAEEQARRDEIQAEMKRESACSEEEKDEAFRRNLALFEKFGFRATDQDLH